MKRWMIGGIVGACIGVSIYLILTRKTESQPEVKPAAIEKTEVAPAAIPAPAVLPAVVEVADLDPLLDPPVRPATGAPFDTDHGSGTLPVSVPAAPPRIPPSVD